MVREGLCEDMMVKQRRQTGGSGSPILSSEGSEFQAEGRASAKAQRLERDPCAGGTVRILLLHKESFFCFDPTLGLGWAWREGKKEGRKEGRKEGGEGGRKEGKERKKIGFSFGLCFSLMHGRGPNSG